MEKKWQNKLDNFLSETPTLPKIIAIYGPTASGKSRLAIEVATYINNSINPTKQELKDGGGVYGDGKQRKISSEETQGFSEIISVDARQIYRHMNIGTGKITPKEMEGIPHHMLDIRNPNEPFSVVDFRREASIILEDIRKRGKTPILCGGTGLYLDSLIYERDYMGDAPNLSRRRELEDFRLKNGNQALWKKLYNIDPDYARKLHPNNHTYIIRGIEIMEETGRSKLESVEEIPRLKYPTLFLTPYDGDREQLYEKINTRVKEMFGSGLIEEVGYIIKNFGRNCVGLRTIGYKEVADFLDGKISLEESIQLVQQHNRNYAKRQITWNKKYAENQ